MDLKSLLFFLILFGYANSSAGEESSVGQTGSGSGAGSDSASGQVFARDRADVLVPVDLTVRDESKNVINEEFNLDVIVKEAPLILNGGFNVRERTQATVVGAAFRVMLQPGQKYAVSNSGPGSIGPSISRFAFAVPIGPGPFPITLELERGATVRGKIIDADGRVLKNLGIEAAIIDGAGETIDELSGSVSDPAQDEFELPHVPLTGRLVLSISSGEQRIGHNGTKGTLRPIRHIVALPVAGPLVIRMTEVGREIPITLTDEEGKPLRGLDPQSIVLDHVETGESARAWYDQDGQGLLSDIDERPLPLGSWKARVPQLSYHQGLALSHDGFAFLDLHGDTKSFKLPLIPLPRLTVQVVIGEGNEPAVGQEITIESLAPDKEETLEWAGHAKFKTNAEGKVTVYTTVGPKRIVVQEQRYERNTSKDILVTPQSKTVVVRSQGVYAPPARNVRMVVDGFAREGAPPVTQVMLFNGRTGDILDTSFVLNREVQKGPITADIYLPPTEQYRAVVIADNRASPVLHFAPQGLQRPLLITLIEGHPVGLAVSIDDAVKAWSQKYKGGFALIGREGVPVALWPMAAAPPTTLRVLEGSYRLCWFGTAAKDHQLVGAVIAPVNIPVPADALPIAFTIPAEPLLPYPRFLISAPATSGAP